VGKQSVKLAIASMLKLVCDWEEESMKKCVKCDPTRAWPWAKPI